ncbi:hypothetical protein Tco_0258934, partial [Tanacetum coccineum]
NRSRRGINNDPDLELAKKMSLEALQEKGEGEGNDADMERAIKLSLDPAFLPQVGKGKAIVTEEQVAHSTTGSSSQPEDDTSEKVIHESSSTSEIQNEQKVK